MRFGVVVLLVFLVGSVFGHDMWLAPDRFVISKGDTLTVRMLIGHDLEPLTESELLRTMTPTFDLITVDTTINLLAGLPDMRTKPAVLPVLRRRLDFEGLGLVTMEHGFIYTEFETAGFRSYLQEEGFEDAFGPQLGQDSVQSERYARMFKSLIQVGDVSEGDLHKRIVGQTNEILLIQNPYLLDPGDTLDIQLLFESTPLANRQVTALRKNSLGQISISKAATNENGMAAFKLDESGFWLIQTIQMRPSPEPYTDWESFWSSYSFWLD